MTNRRKFLQNVSIGTLGIAAIPNQVQASSETQSIRFTPNGNDVTIINNSTEEITVQYQLEPKNASDAVATSQTSVKGLNNGENPERSEVRTQEGIEHGGAAEVYDLVVITTDGQQGSTELGLLERGSISGEAVIQLNLDGSLQVNTAI